MLRWILTGLMKPLQNLIFLEYIDINLSCDIIGIATLIMLKGQSETYVKKHVLHAKF